MFQGALEKVESEAESDEVLVVMVLGMGTRTRKNGLASPTAVHTGGKLTSSVCMSHGGGGEDLSCDRIASKAALLYR